jgi:DNA-binding transcriptional ArsR family regulator
MVIDDILLPVLAFLAGLALGLGLKQGRQPSLDPRDYQDGHAYPIGGGLRVITEGTFRRVGERLREAEELEQRIQAKDKAIADLEARAAGLASELEAERRRAADLEAQVASLKGMETGAHPSPSEGSTESSPGETTGGRILDLLSERPLKFGDLVKLTGKSEPTVAKWLRRLLRSGEVVKEGGEYRLAGGV